MTRTFLDDGSALGQWWHTDPASDRVICDLCPRECHLKDGDRGFCFVRENRGGQMVLSTYGKSTGFCIDPIEKKPLNHFYPGTSVLSFGTAGCNLGCKFCQNWEISKSREVERLSQIATPEAIALAASELGCRSVAFTYNDPVVWAEYAIDTARACRAQGIKSVAVTAGYIHPVAREAFYETMDAANVDLKAFTEDFYWKTTNSHLAPVLETLEFLKCETQVWFEITNLMIPDANDSHDEVKRMSEWIVDHLGPDVPIHFTAFHPDFRMKDRPNTPPETLFAAYEIAKKAGIHYVYVGNIHDKRRQSTYCPACQRQVIERDWYVLGQYAIENGCCRECYGRIAGCFDDTPGDWGSRRQPIDMAAWSTRIETKESNKGLKIMTLATEPISNPILEADALTVTQRESLLELTGRLISQIVLGRRIDVAKFIADSNLEALLNQPVFGLFTTLKRGSQLRGCCGTIGVLRPLGDMLLNACQRTALEDNRMPAISPAELPYLGLDISLLEQLEPIEQKGADRIGAFEIGKHGLRIQRGQQSGLLLPSVSVEHGWNAEEFLQGVCRKAGLGENDWMDDDCVLQRFAGTALQGSIEPSTYAGLSLRRPPILNESQLVALQQSVAGNLMAMIRGATPSYFVPNAPDGTVNGLVLSLFESESNRPLLHLIRLSMRPGMPMQSSLFELTTGAFQALQSLQSASDIRIEVTLAVLQDPSAHGVLSIAKQDFESPHTIEKIVSSIGLEGLAGSSRAIIAIAGGERVVVSLAPESQPELQIFDAIKTLAVSNVPIAIYSMDALSTRPLLMATNVVQPKADATDRHPAVAGAFYPAEDSERRTMLQKIFDDLPPQQKNSAADENNTSSSVPKRLLAIMTPHAGIAYSGRVTAHVWREVDFPRRLLVISPKHTQQGVSWAVAPNQKWKLSGTVQFDNDLELSAKLVECVDGMQLDSSAHEREHGIECQLPFLEHLAPGSKLAAVAMHGATWPSIQTAAKQLASILSNDPDPPLLVISSDMNHYAEDSENRRRDRLALDAIQGKDPEELIRVCRQHEISMCGLIPAAVVMQTLAELGVDYHVQEVAYATSGDVVKSDRVVGYAGLLFYAK